jgi:2-polyprenyl-3-methyl-5-hydroxy-6-metoxy-1,4-benzoquinol methylase
VVTCFAVLEHIEKPLEFISNIRKLLKPTGYLLLSTPNVDDWLIDFLPRVYDQFFFRYVHQWYFGADSLKHLAELTGLTVGDISYKQRFDLSNALHWANLERPTGLSKLDLFSELDESYQSILEKKGKSDFIYVKLTLSENDYV